MQRSQSESWYGEVEPLKIKSALTRKGSKSKLKGPREFSPLIGSSRPKKAVTFDRTDEVITYEQLTPEVHEDWRFAEQEYEVVDSLDDEYDRFDDQPAPPAPLHTLPVPPENTGIEKSISEPSMLHAVMRENRMSVGDRVGAVMDASPVPTFQPGHKHKDSWRGSWGTITESLGAREPITSTQFEESPQIQQDNHLFEELPAITRKESLQDEQRRPKTMHIRANPIHKARLERTHSQRKRAIRHILEGESNISTIEEESSDNEVKVLATETAQEAPEIPPHSPIPSLNVQTSSPVGVRSPNYTSTTGLSVDRMPVSPSLESVATFEANVTSVERAQSSTPVLTSVGGRDMPFNYEQGGGAPYHFEKLRTSTPSSHPLPDTPRRVPSPINELPEYEEVNSIQPVQEETQTEAHPEQPSMGLDERDLSEHVVPKVLEEASEATSMQKETRDISYPQVLAPLSASTSADSWSKWENTEDVERAYMSPSSEESADPESSREPTETSRIPQTSARVVSGGSANSDKASSIASLLPEIPERTSSQGPHMFDLPDISVSPSGLNAHMFDSSSGSSALAQVLGAYDRTDSKPLMNSGPSTSILPASSSERDIGQEPVTEEIAKPSFTPSPASSQRDISQMTNATYDFDASNVAVHEKKYASTPRPIAIDEVAEHEALAETRHTDVRKAPPMLKKVNVLTSNQDHEQPVHTRAPVVTPQSVAQEIEELARDDPALQVEFPDKMYSESEYSQDPLLDNMPREDSSALNDSTVEALKPYGNADFSFAETRKTTPLHVAPLNIPNESVPSIDNSVHSDLSALSKVSMKGTPALKVSLATEIVDPEHEISETTVYCQPGDTSIVDQPSSKEEELPSLQAVEASKVVDDPIDATVDNSVLTEHVTSHSVSTEPLVVRAMDKDESDQSQVVNKAENEEEADNVPDIVESLPEERGEAETTMISPPTPSLAYSHPGSRVTSGASTAANGTVVHTPFLDDSEMVLPPRPGARLGFSPGFPSPELEEKYHSPELEQQQHDHHHLILDSDLSEDEDQHVGEDEGWITETESEFGSKRVGLGSSLFGSDYGSHIPSRIPTFQAENRGAPVSASDIHQTYSTTEGTTSQGAFGYPSTGTSTIPNTSSSRWSTESIRDDSIFSMQMGQSLDSFSSDLNRVASSATIDRSDSQSGYILREHDSVIMANADRIFKTNRRRTTTRRKPVPMAESLSTHPEEESEATQDYDQSLSVRKRNQNSFATRQPSHIVVSRNATPQKAARGTSSTYGSESREPSVAVGRQNSMAPSVADSSVYSGVRVETPHRDDMPVEAPAPIREPTQEERAVHIDVRQPPPMQRAVMPGITELSETPQTALPKKFPENGAPQFSQEISEAAAQTSLPAKPVVEHNYTPRPISAYEPRQYSNYDDMRATADPYQSKRRSAPIVAKEKGHLFISIESISGYNLPDGEMNISLDNGEQSITTDAERIGKSTMFNKEYDIFVRDGLSCEVTVRAFIPQTKDNKRASFTKFFKRNKKELIPNYTPISPDGTLGRCKIHFKDFKQFAYGKPYSASLACFDRFNQDETCKINVKMMYIPIMSSEDIFPTSMQEALEEIEQAKQIMCTTMTGYMTQHGGDCRNPKRRYFILDDDMLIAHSDKSHKPRATINLRKAVYLAPDVEDELKFKVNFRNGSFINFTVEQERQKWMEALDSTIHNKRNRSSWLSLVMYTNEQSPIRAANMLTSQAVI